MVLVAQCGAVSHDSETCGMRFFHVFSRFALVSVSSRTAFAPARVGGGETHVSGLYVSWRGLVLHSALHFEIVVLAVALC